MKKLITVMLMAVLTLTVGFSQPVPTQNTDQAGETINGPGGGGGIGGNRHVRA